VERKHYTTIFRNVNPFWSIRRKVLIFDKTAVVCYNIAILNLGVLAMKHKLRSLICLILCAVFITFAQPARGENTAAEDLTASSRITGTGYSDLGFLTDKNIKGYKTSSGNTVLTVENSTPMAGLYLLFDLEYGEYTLKDNTSGKTHTAGKQGILHDYLDLAKIFGGSVTSVTLEFSHGAVRLSELYVFSAGKTPDFVQKWDAPLDGGADLLLLATHGDDDQLFFAGLLPYYAKAMDNRVQVAYLTDHRNLTKGRTHEMLNGLWAVGVTAYPVFGEFADFRIDDLQGTYDEYAAQGVSKDMLQKFVVQQLRRFKPLVAVGHDLKGEYGHGMHMVYADLLTKGLELSKDPAAYPDLASQYGVWDVPKTYLHLYGENRVTLDIDRKLDSLGGMSAFEVTQKFGYPCHESQQYTWFTDWLNGKNGNTITKASQITTYNPAEYGLYRSTVGADALKNTFFENIVTYAEQERLEQERLEQERLEQERLEQERLEQERLEQERLEQERLEQERLEQERLEQEHLEQERLEQERLKREAEKRRELYLALGLLAVLVLLLVAVLGVMMGRKRRTRVPGRKPGKK